MTDDQPINEQPVDNRGALNILDDGISQQLNEHGKEIRSLADLIDSDGDHLSEVLDDIASEMKGHYGAQAANEMDDDDDEKVVASVERWITNNVSNASTDRRVAAAYVFLGRNEALKRLEQDEASTVYEVTLDETRQVSVLYTVRAASQDEALEKAARGETISEKDLKIKAVLDRTNIESVKN